MNWSIAVIFSTFLFAAEICCSEPAKSPYRSFQCEIIEARIAGKDGTFTTDALSDVSEGQEFIIDKISGQISGKIRGQNFTPEVVYFGDSENSYRAMDRSPGQHISYIQVFEWVDGLEKPFLWVDAKWVYTGLCKGY